MKKRTILLTLFLMAVSVTSLIAQPTDPAIQAAKEETEVIYDLGRFFGYILTIEENDPDLILSSAQVDELIEIMLEIKSMERIEADWAEEKLTYLELDFLTPDQLLAVDMIVMNRESSSDGTGSGTGAGKGSSGSGETTGENPLQTYINGGPFNPVIDDSKGLGEGFAELLTDLQNR